jgi:uncharacterized membrane protein HdeD (DUF308 family)
MQPVMESAMSTPFDVPSLQRRAREALRTNWRMFLIEGIVLVVLGVLAVVVPPFATLAVTILLGWVFLASGVLGLYSTYMMRHAPGFWWSLLSAALAILAGGVLLARPVTGAVSLTLVLICFFIVEGVASIMFALAHRNELAGRWVWMLVSGVIDIGLSIFIFAGLPLSAAWAIGLLVGINMMFGGAALIGMALQARHT